MQSSISFWIATIMFLAYPSDVLPRSQPGLFDMFGNGNQNMDRPIQPTMPTLLPNFHLIDPNSGNSNNNNNNDRNVNLISLFPQNNNIVPTARSQLDSETEKKLTEQKDKLEDILEKLKEMNKDKEDAEKQKNPNGNRNPNTNNIYNEYKDRQTTHKPVVPTNKPKTDVEVPTNNVRPVQKTEVWKKLNVKKFHFQVKPVRPDDEVANNGLPETLYYIA